MTGQTQKANASDPTSNGRKAVVSATRASQNDPRIALAFLPAVRHKADHSGPKGALSRPDNAHSFRLISGL